MAVESFVVALFFALILFIVFAFVVRMDFDDSLIILAVILSLEIGFGLLPVWMVVIPFVLMTYILVRKFVKRGFKSIALYGSLMFNIFLYLFCLTVGLGSLSGSAVVLDLWDVFIGIVVLAGILAIIGFGSMFFSLADPSVRIFISLGLYIGVWMLFGTVTFNYLLNIPYGLGALLWTVSFVMYCVGAVMTMTHAGSSNE